LPSALVIGFGSIGARHARLLAELGCDTAVVSQRAVPFPKVFGDLQRGLAGHAPDYVVIANATSQHLETMEALAHWGYQGTLVVEKPIFDHVFPLPAHRFGLTAVAYNLRFHPVLQALKRALQGETLLTAHAYAGQYLPDWRPGTDYRRSYSADATRGGGVLRDLSHELDYLGWLLGGARRVAALGGHFSPLEISSEDAFAMLFDTALCPMVSVQLNYLDRAVRRVLVVNTANHSFEADLVKGTLTKDRAVEHFVVGRDDTYKSMHGALLHGVMEHACSLEEGLVTMRLIEAASASARQIEWIHP
jgi:predicted dehydrogenase